MSINVNWERWIIASISSHFSEIARVNSIYMFVEGTNRREDIQSELIEFRWTGPRVTDMGGGLYQLDFGINILFQVVMGADYHRPMQISGILLNGFTDICVYRYGDGPSDDQQVLGVARLIKDVHHPHRSNFFGQVGPDIKKIQGTVDGSYRIYLP